MRKNKFQIKRIGGYLHKITPIRDSKGKIIEHVITPLMVELRPRDILQIIVGASILAIPVGMTEETWNLGAELPILNVMLMAVIGICFIAFFVYFNFYRNLLKGHVRDYILRVAMIYIISLLLVAGFLIIIQKTPWLTDPLLALKRLLIITFPCSMSATISDIIK